MKVSICTSVFNQAHLVRPMIASVIGQSLSDWEFIVVDDGSTEDIKSICAEWNDPRISYVRLPENMGIPHGIKHAVTLATGDYVQLIAADERIDLNKLLWQTGYLDDHPNIAGIWGLPQNGPAGERPSWEQYALKAHNRSKQAWIRTLIEVDHIPLGGVSWLVRRAALLDIGNFDTSFCVCSDLELFVRFFQKYNGVVLPYRWHWCEENPGSASRTITQEDFQREIAAVRAKHAVPMPMPTGSITVAIPMHNAEAFLPATIASLQAQTHQDFYIHMLDDASTDGTYAIAAGLKDSRSVLQKFDVNRGPSEAWNQMLARCNTPFFVCLSADDTLDPTFLERCVAEFQRDPALEFVASQTDFIDVAGKPVTAHPFLQIQKATNRSREQWLDHLYYGNNYFGAGMYRTYAAREVSGWDKSVGVIADYEMYLKILQRGNIHVIEENLTHTRIHDAQRSLLKGREAVFKLRQDYHTVKSRYYRPRMKVIIATPFYEMRGFSPYISSMTHTIKALTQMGIEHEFWELSGDSYVDRAKNTLFNKFLEDPAATDLFMIDSDMQWNAQSFINMLQFPEEIVQASYPQKNAWETWTARPLLVEHDGRQEPVGRMLADGSALIKAEYLAGGFLRVKRPCLEKYKAAYPEHVYHDAGADPNYPERLYTEFFTCERAKNEAGVSLRWGEDRVFGRRMMAIGVESWIYPNVDMGHYGIKGWMGNYDTFLKRPPEVEKAA